MIACSVWKPAPCASCHGCEEAEQARAAIRLEPDRGEPERDRDRPAGGEDPQRHSGHDEDRAEDDPDRDHGPEVGLEQDQAREEPGRDPDRPRELLQRLRRPMSRQIRGRPDREAELGELRGLEGERADAEPAARPVHLLAEHEHGETEAEAREHQDRRQVAERPVVDPRGDQEQDDAERRVDRLALEVEDRVAAAERRRRRGRAVDHHEPERGQAERDEDEDVRVELAALQPATSATRRLKASPRSSKSWNWS